LLRVETDQTIDTLRRATRVFWKGAEKKTGATIGNPAALKKEWKKNGGQTLKRGKEGRQFLSGLESRGIEARTWGTKKGYYTAEGDDWVGRMGTGRKAWERIKIWGGFLTN